MFAPIHTFLLISLQYVGENAHIRTFQATFFQTVCCLSSGREGTLGSWAVHYSPQSFMVKFSFVGLITLGTFSEFSLISSYS